MPRSTPALMALALCVSLSACASNGDPEDASSSGSASLSASEVIVWADQTMAPVIESAGKAWTSITGVPVTVEQLDVETIHERVARLAPAGEGPDLFLGSSTWVGELVEGGIVAPLDLGAGASGFADVAVKAFAHGGSGYGMPLGTQSVALLRNTALAPEAPTSVDDMVTTGLALHAKDAKVLPLALPVGSFGDLDSWYPLLSGSGGALFGQDADGSYDQDDVLVGSAGSVAAAEQLADLAERGVIDKDLTVDGALELFTAGRSPYLVGSPLSLEAVQEAAVPVSIEAVPGAHDGDPSGQSLVNVTGLLASAFSAAPDAAADLVRNGLMTTSFMSAAATASGDAPAWDSSFQAAATDPATKAFGEVARASAPTPNLAVMSDTWTIMGQAELDVIDGDDPTTVMRDAAQEISAAVDAR